MTRSGRLGAAGFLAIAGWLAPSGAADAQLRPYTSGAVSFNAPEMRKHGSGLYRPRRTHVHHGHFHRPLHQSHRLYR